MQKAFSFTDALVYACLGPRANASLEHSLQFVRPRFNTKLRPVTRATAPIIEISSDDDDEDDDDGGYYPLVVVPDPPTLMDPAPAEHHGTKVPRWLLDMLAEREPGMFSINY